MLAHIIRFYGDALQGFMSTYLEKSMQVFVGQQDQFRKQMDNLVGTGPWTLMTDLTERNLDAWRRMQSGVPVVMGVMADNRDGSTVKRQLGDFFRAPLIPRLRR